MPNRDQPERLAGLLGAAALGTLIVGLAIVTWMVMS